MDASSGLNEPQESVLAARDVYQALLSVYAAYCEVPQATFDWGEWADVAEKAIARYEHATMVEALGGPDDGR